MAVELAAAAWAAEEVVSTTVQIGVGAYMVAKPTAPLHATFTQIATSSDDDTKYDQLIHAWRRSMMDNKAYIFGGETASGQLAGTEIHAITLTSDKTSPDYSVTPAIADVEANGVPAPRQKHAACGFNVCIAVFGGVDQNGQVIDEQHVWLYNTGKSAWETLRPKDASALLPSARSEAKLFDHRNNLVLYGGKSKNGEGLHDVWLFNYVQSAWHQLPDAPVSSDAAALTNGMLHIISNGDRMGSDLHLLPLNPTRDPSEQKWHTVPFPSNPLTPGPQTRSAAGLVPVTTGYGRHYLIYLFGVRPKKTLLNLAGSTEPAAGASEKEEEQPLYWSDIWTYQLPSSPHEAKFTANIMEAVKPAKIKDSIRSALGYDTGGHSWTETEVLPPSEVDLDASTGKVHPGPRGNFACDVMEDGKSIVLWGGINAKGEKEGDGWVVKLS
ncbi:hypothetical protein LTR62_001203 [Meristemomyces frigidus]|uniref:Galactose oxidase n=1 Tax=Meristemomyces frigidus TaxID=1508187 RepID=A0AAN7YLV8_9PEZI|nr:hypothetical protein LTR62_001203 [Meristemomyces frigidus]